VTRPESFRRKDDERSAPELLIDQIDSVTSFYQQKLDLILRKQLSEVTATVISHSILMRKSSHFQMGEIAIDQVLNHTIIIDSFDAVKDQQHLVG